MASRYCTCGGKTEYSVKAPTFCSACGQPFVKAFTPIQTMMASKAIAHTPIAARQLRHERPSDDPDSTAYDESEVESYARELAASFSTSDFFATAPAPSAGFRLADVLDKDKPLDVGGRAPVVVDPSQLPPISE